MRKLSAFIGRSSSHGASMRSRRSAATKVMVFQCPYGTLLRSRAPRGPQPRSGAMLVLVQVSSIKTRRSGSIRVHRDWLIERCRGSTFTLRGLVAELAERCSAASTVFFEAESLGVHEAPHCAVVDLEPAISASSW